MIFDERVVLHLVDCVTGPPRQSGDITPCEKSLLSYYTGYNGEVALAILHGVVSSLCPVWDDRSNVTHGFVSPGVVSN